MLTTGQAVWIAFGLTAFFCVNIKGWLDSFNKEDGYEVLRSVSQMLVMLVCFIWFLNVLGVFPK